MIKHEIKKGVLYVFALTGAVVFLLAIIVMLKGEASIHSHTIFQIGGANALITAGVMLSHKIEFRYAVLEIVLDISFIIAVIVIFGALCGWYSTTPVWILVLMVIIIYALFFLLDIVGVHKKIKEINELLEKINKKDGDTGGSAASW